MNQYHAGRRKDGSTIWHTNDDGTYWSGSWHHRTPEELLIEAETTIEDLLRNHPEIALKRQIQKALEKPISADRQARIAAILDEPDSP